MDTLRLDDRSFGMAVALWMITLSYEHITVAYDVRMKYL